MTDDANRNDARMLVPTIEAIADIGLLADIGTVHLDCGYDYPIVREWLGAFGLDDLNIQRRRTKEPGKKQLSDSGCAGSSGRQIHGGRTTASSAATPTVEPVTATLRSASTRRS